MTDYDVYYYCAKDEDDMDPEEHVFEMPASSPREAVENFLRMMAAYKEGTKGHDEYAEITEVTVDKEGEHTVIGYRKGEAWEIHYNTPGGSGVYALEL